MSTRAQVGRTTITDPPFAARLLGETNWAWLWLIARIYVGWAWLTSGWGKLSNPAWVDAGSALKGFWERAAALPTPPARPVITFDWYRSFIQALLDAQAYTWFAKLVVAGEILIGLALIMGVFTGIAAFAGGFMNWNFMMAGTASTNPVLFTLAILLILAWKTAGWWGLDRWLLPLVGTPWRPNVVLDKSDGNTEPTAEQKTS